MGEPKGEFTPPPQADEKPRTETAPQNFGIRLWLQFELITEYYGLPEGEEISNATFLRWTDEGHGPWFTDFIDNDPETVALLAAGKIDEAKVKIGAAFDKRRKL